MKPRFILFASLFAAAGIGGASLWLVTKDPCDTPLLYAALQKDVSAKLKAPATAVWPEWDQIAVSMAERMEPSIADNFRCSFKIDGYVDAQNSFGALVRTRFVGNVWSTDDGPKPVVSILD